jgi:serine/threonine protein kinase
LKLIDLGVARLPQVEDFHADEIPGTPGFMAPEQFEGIPATTLLTSSRWA